MDRNEIYELVNGRVNKELKQWYEAKVHEIALLFTEKLRHQATERLELEKNIRNLPLETTEEVLSK